MPRCPYYLASADLQLGTLYANLAPTEEDAYQAWLLLCRLAAEDPACLGVLLAGDVRDGRSLHARALERITQGGELLRARGKKAYFILGNHDRTNPNWVFALRHPALVDLTEAPPPGVAGFHFHPKPALNDLKAKLAGLPPEARIVLLHQSVAEFSAAAQFSDLSLEGLAQYLDPNLERVVVCGDVHNYGDALNAPGQWVISPGSAEMTDIDEGARPLRSQRYGPHAGRFQKFYLEIEAETLEWRRVPFRCRPWYFERVRGPEAAQAALERLSAPPYDAGGAIVRLLARGPALDCLRRGLDPARFLQLQIQEWPEGEDAPEPAGFPEGPADAAPPASRRKAWVLSQVEAELARDQGLSPGARDLIEAVLDSHGAGDSTRHDVAHAFHAWAKQRQSDASADPL